MTSRVKTDCVVYIVNDAGWTETHLFNVALFFRIAPVQFVLTRPSECLTLFASWLGAP